MQRTVKQQLRIFDLTFPQIIVKGKYIGGADDLSRVVEENRFSTLLSNDHINTAADYSITWDDDLLSMASKPDLFKVPRVRAEGAWYPDWPYYVFQWTVHANLIRYISVIQIIVMGCIFVLIETSEAASGAMSKMQQNLAVFLLCLFLADIILLTAVGVSPFSPSGVIATYFGWKSRGNATSVLPYKAVFAAYIFGTCIALNKYNKAENEEEVASALDAVKDQMVGYISNSALLAVFRF